MCRNVNPPAVLDYCFKRSDKINKHKQGTPWRLAFPATLTLRLRTSAVEIMDYNTPAGYLMDMAYDRREKKTELSQIIEIKES